MKNIINFGIGPLFRMEWGKDSVHIHEHAFSVDAAYLICTDGVNDLFTDAEIFDILMPMPARGGHRLLKALEEKGLKRQRQLYSVKCRSIIHENAGQGHG